MNALKINQAEINASVFSIFSDSEELIRFEKNGDIFIKGKLAENDKEVVDGFRKFLKLQGLM